MTVTEVAFLKPSYTAELGQWLAHRASPQDADRCQRFLALIQQTAGRTGGRAESASEASMSLARTARACKAGMLQTAPVRPASACEGGWLHTGTVATLRRAKESSMLTMSPAGAPGRATASRPGTAAPAVNGQQQRPRTATQQQQQQHQHQHQQLQLGISAFGQSAIAGSRPGTAPPAAAAATAGSAAAAASPRFANPLSVTTSHATYGLKELYPDLYATILPIARPDPCPNKNFISEWGEAMKQGAEQAWKPYLQSTYEVHNHIATASKPGSADHKQRADSALAAWVGKQHLYYGDVFAPAQRDAIGKLLVQLQGDERRALVDMLRQLHSVLQPDRTKPFSHVEHKQQFSVEDEETTKLMKAQTKIRTMGMPKQAKVIGLKTAPAAPPKAADAPAVKAPAKKKKAVTAADMIETLVSNVPIKQAVASVAPATSTYNTAFRGAPAGGLQMEPAPFKDVNVGFGHVNTTLYPTHIPDTVIPLPAHFVTQPRLLGDAPSGEDMKTTYRNAFMPRSHADVMRSVAAAQEQIAESQAARNKSFIPLSKAGIQYGSSAQWGSIYDGDFKDKKVDLTANHAMAEAVGAMFNGPTISWGKIAGIRAQRPAAA